MTRRLALPLLVLASALLLAACGGGGGSESDEDQITDVITTSVTSTDPANCEALETLAFMEQQAGTSDGKEAVAECEEEAKDSSGKPKEAKVTKVKVSGADATADVAFVGGSFDGQKVTVALVEEDGDWKLDQIEGFVDFDKEKLVSGFEKGFQDAELSPEQQECISEQLREASDSDLEELVLNGSEEAFVELVAACIEGG